MQPAAGALIAGRFRVLGHLGRGGMALVLRALDEGTGREVALKLALPGGEQRLERFRREGEIAAALRHSGIVQVHAAGEALDGAGEARPWLAFELVPGARPLDEAARGLPVERRVALVRDAAAAVGHAHAHGVVHRDLKPENILVDAEGRVRVADFGVALMAGLERLTLTGAVVGTPSYMAPEQVAGARGDVGPWTDVWALGVLLHELLTGDLPFEAGSAAELVAAICGREPAPPSADGAPEALDPVVSTALSKSPRARYPDAGALAADLDAWLAGRRVAARPRRRPVRLLAGGGLLAALGFGAVAAASRTAPLPDAPAAAAPAVRLEDVDAAVASERLRVRGRVAFDADWVELSLEVEGAPPWPPLRLPGPASAGRPFDLDRPVPPGAGRVLLRARDALGREAPAVERSWSDPGPAWVGELPPDRRPPLPLPAGLEPTATKGVFRNRADGSELVWVPPGELWMGTSPRNDEEGPRHRVTLTRGFYLGRLEVTVAQRRRWARAAKVALPPPPSGRDPRPDEPALGVRWSEAVEYCAWAGLRLPTEAEWEWAARGPDGRLYPWGDEAPSLERAWFGTPVGAEPVGQRPAGASPFGCLDMAGNAAEWTSDRSSDYDEAPIVDPKGGVDGGERQIRGGSWEHVDPRRLRSTWRHAIPPEERATLWSVGFRVARDDR